MKWFEIWFEDEMAMLDTMTRNMVADLEAGYNPNGNCIRRQAADIENRKARFDARMEVFKYTDDKEVDRWCYYDLKKRGAIA